MARVSKICEREIALNLNSVHRDRKDLEPRMSGARPPNGVASLSRQLRVRPGIVSTSQTCKHTWHMWHSDQRCSLASS